jgi:hypothetical protein
MVKQISHSTPALMGVGVGIERIGKFVDLDRRKKILDHCEPVCID